MSSLVSPLPVSSPTRASLALSAAALLWSGNFIVGRALHGEIDPAGFNLLRWTVCLAAMLPWVGAKAWRHRAVVAREWRLLLGLGATGIAAFHSLVYLALQTTTAIHALLMLSLTPTAMLGVSALQTRSRPTRGQLLGTVVSLLGAGVLVTRGHALSGPLFHTGDLWMLAAVLLWALYSALLRTRPTDLPQDVTLACSIVPALGLLLPWVMASPGPWPDASTVRVLAALAYVGLFASMLAFLLWSYGVSVLGPERAGPFVQLMPVFGAGMAMAWLGEQLGLAQVAGAAGVLAGIALVLRRR